ncbi:MAG: DUF3833 family protein [Caldimonas sp.]
MAAKLGNHVRTQSVCLQHGLVLHGLGHGIAMQWRHHAQAEINARRDAATDDAVAVVDTPSIAPMKVTMKLNKAILASTLVLGSLCGCAAVRPPSAFEDGRPEMRPEVFFAGVTSSSGIEENRSGAPTGRFFVKGRGQTLPDGMFRLEQSITFDQKAPETRTWVMQRVDAHRYTATLTDASSLVTAEAYGDLFHLHYSMKTPLGAQMEQWLYLQPDSRTVMNEATVRVFGVVVAHLSERITRDAR